MIQEEPELCRKSKAGCTSSSLWVTGGSLDIAVQSPQLLHKSTQAPVAAIP